MDWYKRWVGDYLSDTATLSLTEHGAYNLMLDYHYKSEEPLPKNREEIYIMLRAIRQIDQDAVDKVLERYWQMTDAGWVNNKALEMIDDYRKMAARNKRIATERETKRARKEHVNSTERSTTRVTERSTGSTTKPESRIQSPEERRQKKDRSSDRVAESQNNRSVVVVDAGESASAPAAIQVPLRDNSLFAITETELTEYRAAYPKLAASQNGNGLHHQLGLLVQWNLSNPDRRKTKRGIARHINAWLTKEESKLAAPRRTGRMSYQEVTDNNMALMRRLVQ